MKKKIWMMAVLPAAVVMISPILAMGQTPEMAAIKSAADALGGVERVRSVKALIMEGEGANPNVGQNLTPDAPLTDWKVTGYRKTIDLARLRMRFEQRRDAQFPFSMANIGHQNFVLDGDLAFNVDRQGKATRAPDAAVRDRRIEMLNNPVAIVRAALDGVVKVSHLRKENRVQAIDLKTAQGDELTLTLDAATHRPASLQWISSSDNLGDIHNETFYTGYALVSGLQLPRHYVNKIDFRNYTTADIRISKNVVDGDPGNLEAPAAVKAAAPPQPPPITVDPVEAAPGIWWMKGSGNHSEHLVYLRRSQDAVRSAGQRGAGEDGDRAGAHDRAGETTDGDDHFASSFRSHGRAPHGGGRRADDHLAPGQPGIFPRARCPQGDAPSRRTGAASDALRIPRRGQKKAVLKDKALEVDLFQMKDNIHCHL